MKYSALADSVAAEVKDEYTLAVKKAVVDFVLGDSLHKPNIHVDNPSSERLYLRSIAVKYKHRSLEEFSLVLSNTKQLTTALPFR